MQNPQPAVTEKWNRSLIFLLSRLNEYISKFHIFSTFAFPLETIAATKPVKLNVFKTIQDSQG